MKLPKSLSEITNHRSFIYSSISRDFQMKYQSSILGFSWIFINPLITILIYTLIFSQVMHFKLATNDSPFAYSIFLCSGILVWGFFSEVLNRFVNVFVEHANVIKKIQFPKILLPMIVVSISFINFFIVFLLFLFFLLITGSLTDLSIFSILPVIAIILLFSCGLGIVLGVLNVFFRDVSQFFNIFLQFWFWLTPILYPLSAVPVRFQSLIKLNPMTSLIVSIQDVITINRYPDFYSLLYPFIVALALCFSGTYLFRKHSSEIVDEL
jgi:lipopolysaccharide transport system permease protein